jgi:PITH domain
MISLCSSLKVYPLTTFYMLQCLLSPPFCLLQVHSIKFTHFNNGINPEENPSKIHLYVNRENLGFEDCGDVDPTQTLELTAADLRDNTDPTLLKFVKFQKVKSLTFFIEDNAGGDITALGSLKVIGKTISTTNMKDFKKNC